MIINFLTFSSILRVAATEFSYYSITDNLVGFHTLGNCQPLIVYLVSHIINYEAVDSMIVMRFTDLLLNFPILKQIKASICFSRYSIFALMF